MRPRILERLAGNSVDTDFTKKVLATLLTKGLLFFCGLAVSVVISRTLGPGGRGIYALAITIGTLGVQLGNFGLHSSNTFFAAKSPDLIGTLIANTVWLSFGGGATIAGLLWIAFAIWPDWAPIKGWNLTLALIAIPIGLSYLLLQNLLLGCYRVAAFNYIELSNRLINIALLLVLLLNHYVSSATALGANLLATAAATGWSLYVLLAGSTLSSPSWQLLKRTFPYAFRAYLLSFFSFTVLKADTLIVEHLLGAEQTGIYAVAVGMADVLCMAPITVASILFPKLSSMSDPDEKWRKTRSVCGLVGIVMALIGLVCALASSILIRALFGQVFLPAANAFIWLMPGVVFISMTGIWSMYVGSVFIPMRSVFLFFTMSALNIVLNFIFLPTLGIKGASIASSVCYLGCFVGILGIALSLKRKGLSKSIPAPSTAFTAETDV